MTTITLEVPDELAAQLAGIRGRLPELLAQWLRTESPKKKPATNGLLTTTPLYREVVDFLATDPAPEQLTAFKISAAAQERLDDLLEKNQEEELTTAEAAELDAYLQARDLMILLKADARS